MDREEAQRRVSTIWLPGAEIYFGCPAELDESLTEEYAWGWVFYLVPSTPEACKLDYKRCRIAYHRTTGRSIPVGTKGIEAALYHIESVRQQ